jgi:DNA (cytosine-5)-methyltransferase 1
MNGNNKPTVISLFAGCGGSSLGYKMPGFKELLAIDFDKNAVETFKLNFKEVPIWQNDITQIRGEEILTFCGIKEGELDVLDGSPPCQGFSTAGKRKVYDTRNDLVLEYIRLVDELQPKVFVMENVSGMVKGTMKGLFKEYMLKMKTLNYVVKCKLMNTKYYNVPQSRERLIWIGVRKDLGKEGVFPVPNKKTISIKEALKDCPQEGIVYPLKGTALKIAKLMKPGMTGEAIMGNGHWGSFRRLEWNKPAPTIRKTGIWEGKPTELHPVENRVLLLSEIKRLFTFPDTFKMCGDIPEMQLGNSVPPNFMCAIAKTIKDEILT